MAASAVSVATGGSAGAESTDQSTGRPAKKAKQSVTEYARLTKSLIYRIVFYMYFTGPDEDDKEPKEWRDLMHGTPRADQDSSFLIKRLAPAPAVEPMQPAGAKPKS
jgi:hypothetical protein